MKLTVNESNTKNISKDMYGLFFEDINYSLDGGLHAEMLENRNFEALFAYGPWDDYSIAYDGGYGWSLYDDNGAGSYMSYDSTEPLNTINPHYLVFMGKGTNPSFANKAYDGIYLAKGKKYRVSFYAKSKISVTISITIIKNEIKYLVGKISTDSNNWKKYTIEFTSDKEIDAGTFVVSLDKEADVCFDQFSMMPTDAICGVFRTDLVEKLQALNPSFIRFPGGCIIEGNNLDNRYKWKDTIAPLEERKFNWNRWAVHNCTEKTGFVGSYAHYGQTYGVGYYEYFLLCEYLKAKPLPVVNVGLACQYMSTQLVELDSPEMQQFIQDALDLIEFANGDTDTTWGAKRAKMGHPEPFNLEYIGIGNEQWETPKTQFFKRYTMFEKAIHAKYPQMKLIGSAGPDVWTDHYKDAWNWLHEEQKNNDNLAYAIDEHYYVAPEWLYSNTHFYDNYDRKIKVFAGEYACHIKDRAGKMNYPTANTLGAALAEAAFLTGVERNADVVVLASYAPLFARMGYTQWSPDLIWFDGKRSYATPSYYVQQLYSRFRGSKVLKAELDYDGKNEADEKIFASVTEDDNGNIIIKAVNSSANDTTLELDEFLTLKAAGRKINVYTLSGGEDDVNTIDNPDNIKTVQTQIEAGNGKLELKKHSFNVFVILSGISQC
jgi:alpha-L-arabinofuranosidase